MLRSLAVILALFGLAACEREPAAVGASATPAVDPALPAGAVRPKAALKLSQSVQNPWVQIARQPDGAFVQVAPLSIFRYPDSNTAEAWIQLVHREPKQESFREEGLVLSIEFARERYHYLLDCPANRFTILERRIMSAGETVAHSVAMDDRNAPAWRPIRPNGPVDALAGPVCRAA